MALRHAVLLLALAGAQDSSVVAPKLGRVRAPMLPAAVVARPEPPETPPAALLRLPAAERRVLEAAIESAVKGGDLPGAVVVVGSSRGVWFQQAFGRLAVEPVPLPMRLDAVFDLASLTKAVATAMSVSRLVQDGRVGYDQPVSRWIPSFGREDKRSITLRALLTHTSGLPAANDVRDETQGTTRAAEAIARLPLNQSGAYRYSDLGFIVLGAVVERASGQTLDQFAAREVFQPLGMTSTRFRPPRSPLLVPTTREESGFLRGTVHDPRARALGGVAGHAGLFASAGDLARLARALLLGGTLQGTRVLDRAAVDRMTRPLSAPRAKDLAAIRENAELDRDARFTLGWDSPDDPETSAMSPASYGHEGFTGTSLWIDPRRDQFVVMLSSRLHPDGRGKAVPLGREIRRLFAGAKPTRVERPVECGIDHLADAGALTGRRVAMLTHAAARDRFGRRSIDVAFEKLGSGLVRVLTPEHGLDARQVGAGRESVDAMTGLEVRSAYGSSFDAALLGVDTVLVDLVDVGARFYTYEASTFRLLEAAARRHVKVIVLDRPNPLGGEVVEGPLSAAEPPILVDPHPLPLRHGLTLGELSRLFVAERRLALELTVVPARGWARAQHFDVTRQQWFDPSPNLRSAAAAELYPGIALFETTNLSVGRGTPTPFEVLGAPWLDAEQLARSLHVPGVSIRATRFVPAAGPHRGVVCRGLRFQVTDREGFRPVQLGLSLAAALRFHHGAAWQRQHFGLLLGSASLATMVDEGTPVEVLLRRAEDDAKRFRRRRQRFLLYD
ncbi:MAG: DUF1343 domain-containing protein [Polyangiaceae bacterium]